ncbi:hypothetical protein ACGFZP_17660 [Kitasatospora sp. NPDC048239]|uniref:hypothetical protein n=1 Tax=Kitasatospora sp. NPDC048239 TaxID=3364046 RepID=UPI00371FAB1F
MPAPGQITSQIAPSASPAHREFARVLREFCQLITRSTYGPSSQKEICIALETRGRVGKVSQSTLTGLLSATRKPSLHVAMALYGLALEVAANDPEAAAAVPVAAEDLERLYEQALEYHCDCCSTRLEQLRTCDSSRGVGTPTGLTAAAAADSPACPPPLTLPVPPPEGDRQRVADQPPAWQPQEDLERYLRAGRTEDARVVLNHAGTAAAPADVVWAVASCRAAEMDTAADTILQHAGRRDPADVLLIAKLLVSNSWHTDAGVLLGAVGN